MTQRTRTSGKQTHHSHQTHHEPAAARPDAAGVVGVGGLSFTIFTSTEPPRLTKVFGLDPQGRLTKTTAATMTTGTAQRATAANLHDLAAQLDALQPAQAVGWGVADADRIQIVTADHEAQSPADGAQSRTRRNFTFPKGPGVLMLDHDGMPDRQLDRDELHRLLVEACPALADAPMLWRPSASAGLRDPKGSELTGLHRHRLYIPVTDASAIPEAGKRLVALLQAAGLGWHEVGKAGQALKRCLVDASVWQPERLDFAAPPILNDGIQRPKETAHVYGDPAALFDLAHIVVTPEQQQRADAHMRASVGAIKDACAAQREAWAAEKAPELAQRRGIPVEKAHAVLVRASQHAVLMGEYMLICSDGTEVSVGEVLDNAARWHNARFADPLDPDADRRVAWVNLRSGGRPYLFTHRHGGIRFELRRQSARVQVGRGLRIATTDAALQVLRDRGELFDFGEGALAYVATGRARAVSADWLTDHLGRVCDFYFVKVKPDGEVMELTDDAPLTLARSIMAKHGERGFPRLDAVITAPTLRLDGSVLDAPGYDPASRLLYYSDDPNPPRVPTRPTPADALKALRFLWRPFAKFPLVDDVARGVVLQALLTAAIRASLPTAPGIALDAPAAGTGKTLLARCIGILATGSEPSILPPADTDDETRKRLFAALREGDRVLLWDNVREPLGCAALDSFLTAATFKDRILGASETAALPNRALFVATGNNMRLTGDTCRRVFLARLDAQLEKPYARDFDFDPAQLIEADRARYVAAALTIIRAYVEAGRPKVAAGRTASFEAWDDLVRQPVCWLADLVSKADATGMPSLADPLQAAQRAFDQDPETTKHTALLHAWKEAFESQPTTVAAAVRRADTDDNLRSALEEIGGQGARINPRIVGRWIERHVGRRIGGLYFERGSMSRGLATWTLRKTTSEAPTTGNQYTKPTKPTTPASFGPGDGAESGGFGGSGGLVFDHRRVDVDDTEVFQ